MDQSQQATNHSLQETPRKSSDINGSRVSSARSSRSGSVRKDPDAQLNSSINFSSARQRRHSNTSQRSLPIASPRPNFQQSNSSSVFHALSPRHDGDPDAFFTDQDHIQSVDANDVEWEENRQWVDELHRLNSSFTTAGPPAAPLSMSKDSLGATTNHQFQPIRDHDDERILPIRSDLNDEQAASRIQRWYRKQRKQSSQIPSTKPVPINPHRPPTPPPSRSGSSVGSQHSTKNRRSPMASPRVDKMPSVHASVTSVASKITYEDVCEALRKLEDVEQFPLQPELKDDTIYLQVNSSSVSGSSTPKNDHQRSRTSTPKLIGRASPIILPNTPKEKNPLNRNVHSTQDFREKLKEAKRYDDFQHQLEEQKRSYQKSINEHVRFLDEVNRDKKKLIERCESLENQMKMLEKKYENQLRLMEHTHRLEIQRFKDTQMAAEKSRRDKWIEEKSRKLKELTVQSFEPEIQKLIDKYQKEIEDLKETHRAELSQVDVKASERYIRLTDELREELEREKQQAVARERELARDKYEKAIRDERESFIEQRKKLFAEIEEEKNRQTELFAKQRVDFDKLRRNLDEQKQNLTNEIEQRVKLIEEKNENAERQVTKLQNELIDTQTSRDRLEKLLDEKDRQIIELKQIHQQTLEDERRRIEDEAIERSVKFEEENRQLKTDLAEVRARLKFETQNKNVEIEQLKEKQERELATLQEKIQQAVVKKDQQVQELRRQYETVVKRAEQLESLVNARKSTKKT